MAKKTSIALVFFIFLNFLSAQDAATMEKQNPVRPALSLQRYCFEIFRFDITGLSILKNEEEIAKGKELRKFADTILVRPIVYYDGCIKYGIVADLFFSDASSILYSTFDRDDLFPAATEKMPDGESAKIDWVDEVLLSLNYEIIPDVPENESKTETATENSETKKTESEDGEKNNETEKKETDKKTTEAEERAFIKEDGRLRKFTYGDEIFSGGKLDENGKRIVLSAVGNSFKRKFFNDKFVLVKIENWETGSTSRQTYLNSEKEFFYEENAENASKSIETIYKKNKIAILGEKDAENFEKAIEILYDEKGRSISQSNFHFEEDADEQKKSSSTTSSTSSSKKNSETEKKKPPKKIIDVTESWKYDEENRVIEEKKLVYHYLKTAKGKDKNEINETRTVYKYTEKADKPDSMFYENGILRIETTYTNNDAYSQKMYFDDKMMLVLKFENRVKKSEALYGGGRLLRERFFSDDYE